MEEFYDELERRCTEAIELSPGGPVVALNIPIDQWHTVRALESGTVIMEVKDGPYEPTGRKIYWLCNRPGLIGSLILYNA